MLYRRGDHSKVGQPLCVRFSFAAFLFLAAIVGTPSVSRADEGGVSFWLAGLFGSLAAAPQQPGWSSALIYYHTTVSAGADVALQREFEIKNIYHVGLGATAHANASLNATGLVYFFRLRVRNACLRQQSGCELDDSNGQYEHVLERDRDRNTHAARRGVHAVRQHQ